MKFRKIVALSLCAVLSMTALVGCGSKQNNGKIKIGILQYVQHPALDEARRGFVDGLKDAGYVDGKDIEIQYENASAEVATAGTIADTFANEKKDLLLAIATPAAQALANKIHDTPILVTAVTDPADAGLVKSNDNPQTNVSGTSDLSPVAEQIAMFRQIDPSIQKVGIIYCSAEDNSKILVSMAKEELAKQGMEGIDFTVQNSNDVQSVMESMVGKVDAIYAPTDNVISQSMSTVSEIAIRNKLILIAGEEEQVRNGALVTKGITYNELGRQTARMVISILKGEKKVQDMPIEYLEKMTTVINDETAKALGLEKQMEQFK